MKKRLTTQSGSPVGEDNNSISVGERGPLTFENTQLFEKLAHFNRERIPERIVHARGTGAYGYFTLEKDLSRYTIANFLQKEKIGKKTQVFLRFSTVGGGQDSSDYARDPRGFAVKFYTEEGNWDMVGNNTPVFFIRDPQKFPDFVHSQKKNPRTNLPDPASMYEFWANHPQSLHQLTILMSDRGIPYSYRHLNGYSSHTLSFWNAQKERFWIKWHFKTDQGIKTLTNEEASKMPSHGAQKDLTDSIEERDYPSWTVKIQIMTEEEAKNQSFNPFDLTKVWTHKHFPLQTIGKLTLDRNVVNYFSETEQSAFSPGNLVPGIGVSPDKVLQARLLTYPDSQRYRLGVNYNRLSVNAPQSSVNHYQRDGIMADINDNQSDKVNFYPNDDDNLPQPDNSVIEPPLNIEESVMKRFDSMEEDNFSQAGDLFKIMTDNQKKQLAMNIASGLKYAEKSIQNRILNQLEQANGEYRRLVENNLFS